MEISSSQAVVSSDSFRVSNNSQRQPEISARNTGRTPDEQSDKDTVTLSQEGQGFAQSPSSLEKSTNTSEGSSDTVNLGKEEVQKLQELKQRDIEVRTHEQAHLAAAGQYARGGASFTYQKGPDGVSYAVGGEVGIDISKERTPEATITKMQIIKRAALAPASPSGADRSIAAAARFMESQARQEALIQRQEELLHAEGAKNPVASGQEVPSVKQESGNTPPPPAYNSLRTMIAAYQRVASYI